MTKLKGSDTSNRFPLFIPTKGRFESMITSRALTEMGVPHHLVVEPQEMDAYRKAVQDLGTLATVLELDMGYKDAYETCDELGTSISTGSGPARNFAWDYSVREYGAEWHWIMDDNIRSFKRRHKNRRIKCRSAFFFRAMEEFCLRYENVSMAGPHYTMFAPSKQHYPPFIKNSRVYSCNLIRNDVPFRWRGRYNEDTILSLDMLSRGWCTILFFAYLQEKLATQTLKGGNTDELYEGNTRRDGEKYARKGTLAKSQMLVDVHPQYARLSVKWDRVHHHVDYSVFRSRPLKRKPGVDFSKPIGDFKLVEK